MTESEQEVAGPTLIYFNMRGRVEASRLLLHLASQPFTDHRITRTEAWHALQPRLPFAYLPEYREPGFRLSQSAAILRYLAARHGLLPDTLAVQAVCDEAQAALVEAQEALWQFAWQQAYRDEPWPFLNDTFAACLQHLQAHLQRHGDGAWIGRERSHIDCLAFTLLDELHAFFPQLLSRFASLDGFYQGFARLPPIAGYINSGRRPAVFGMGLHGPKVDTRSTLAPGLVFENPWTQPVRLS